MTTAFSKCSNCHCFAQPDFPLGEFEEASNGDRAFLSRLKFAWLIGWHILLPAITVGLASFIAMTKLPERGVATFL
ncbi:hypothetical protein [Mesorhizobium sp. B3-2-1]|uniref:hypothetical protein n=1 Tax=Mesorhizobium sp. B3-2-1 TaxID=2589891 RepID=UPI0015E45B0B|nr:hypothetical protein [Mesorhizobium sp. B3-2-1]